MMRQLHRMRQLAQTGSLGRTPETAEFLGEDLQQVEQRLEPAKRAAHNIHKRLQACLQGQSGADMDKRVVSVVPGRRNWAGYLCPMAEQGQG
ncbi:hypothetical protein MC885_013627 [Smutsia gigantea]|nr:hypothetical protein MC885_013627 [Smutsia gigantea]